MEILRVENLTKSYGKNETKVDAIKNVYQLKKERL